MRQELSSAQFATTIKPRQLPDGPGVHGIDSDELVTSPSFDVAFISLVDFIQTVLATPLAEVSSSDDETEPQRVSSDQLLRTKVLLVAHNGLRFDFPLLVTECLRHNCNLEVLAQWFFVDTLDVVRCCGRTLCDGCARLQCLARYCGCCALHAHRALDDTIACRDVVRHLAWHLNVTPMQLLTLFAKEFDLHATCTNRNMLA